MELRQLRYFVAVAEERHFRRAATRLGMSQPPLTEHIQRLEAELHVRLLDRNRRGVELTRAGRELLSRAQRMLADVDVAMTAARRAAEEAVGQLRLGYVSLNLDMLPTLLERYHQAMPQVDVALSPLPSVRQVAAVQAGELDAGLVRGPLDTAQLRTFVVRRDPFVVLLPAGHRLAGSRVRLGDLAGEPFVMWPHDSHSRQQVLAMCQAEGFQPVAVRDAEPGSLYSIVSLVAKGAGVSVLAAAMGARPGPPVVCKELAACPARSVVTLIWRRDNRSVAIAALVDILRHMGGNPRRAPQRPTVRPLA